MIQLRMQPSVVILFVSPCFAWGQVSEVDWDSVDIYPTAGPGGESELRFVI